MTADALQVECSYAPLWVKQDMKRFPRVCTEGDNGSIKIVNALSPLSAESAKADANAFSKLMSHLKAVDSEHQTVLMVQVENESGVLWDTRDRSSLAQTAFEGTVPADFLDKLRNNMNTFTTDLQNNLSFFRNKDGETRAEGSWESTFGKGQETDELFMAYHYSRYIETVAAAGKSAYAIPLFANAWLRNAAPIGRPDDRPPYVVEVGNDPGVYPSGGPVETVMDIWKINAPTLSFIAPDIYFSDYKDMCVAFRHKGQALFIPEQRRDELGCLYMWMAIGEYGAIGTAPFGIDSDTPTKSPFTFHYGLLAKVSQLILSARTEGRQMTGFYFPRFEEGETDPANAVETQMDGWALTIERSMVTGHPAPGFGIVINTRPYTFLLIGEGFQIKFRSLNPRSQFHSVHHFHEKEVVDVETGELATLRKFNGDESRSHQVVIMPSTDPQYGGFICSAFVPAETRIAECEMYDIVN